MLISWQIILLHFNVKQLKIDASIRNLQLFLQRHVNYANMEGFRRASHILYAASMQWPVVQQTQQHILIHVFIIHTNAIKADQNFSRQDISIIYRLSEVRKDSYLLVAKIAGLV